jgi:hypothetical protein
MDRGMDLEMKTHLRARATSFDGEYDLTGDSNTVIDLMTKITDKAKKMLNPFNKQEVHFNEEWRYYKSGKSGKEVPSDEFIKIGGTIEYIAWSDYGGGNRFEVRGGIVKERRAWVFTGRGRFS